MARQLSKRTRRILTLLAAAGIDAAPVDTEDLGIGSAGLAARGPRDEDGTHTRVRLDDGRSVIDREYTPNGMANVCLTKESAVFALLRTRGLPAPEVLASAPAQSGDDLPGALLLSDAGGRPLEEVFRDLPERDRPALWSAVGATLRRLHDVDPSEAAFLGAEVYQRPWTRFVPYFTKSARKVKVARPDLAATVDELVALRRALHAWFESRPRTVCFGAGYYLPGMLVAGEDGEDGEDGDWRCSGWLSLGYYVSISDPARDVVSIALAHREWTGDDIPDAFFDSYGGRPTPICFLVYEAALQLERGAAYHRGTMRTGWGPPPHSAAVQSLDALPDTVEQLRLAVAAQW